MMGTKTPPPSGVDLHPRSETEGETAGGVPNTRARPYTGPSHPASTPPHSLRHPNPLPSRRQFPGSLGADRAELAEGGGLRERVTAGAGLPQRSMREDADGRILRPQHLWRAALQEATPLQGGRARGGRLREQDRRGACRQHHGVGLAQPLAEREAPGEYAGVPYLPPPKARFGPWHTPRQRALLLGARLLFLPLPRTLR